MENKEIKTKSPITQEKIQEIERLTGGKIGDHYFGPDNKHLLENSFLSKDGKYIGDFKQAEWYVNQKLMVNDQHPNGVANVIFEETYGTDNPVIEGMYGYTHRGGGLFKIGDRLFEESYEPKKEDYDNEEWEKYHKEFCESYRLSEDDLSSQWLFSDGIKSVIPFKRRGKKVIETMEEVFQAAKNMSNYLG